eukprot:jgi/Botrbrau1/19146/Bobra.0077s0058.1
MGNTLDNDTDRISPFEGFAGLLARELGHDPTSQGFDHALEGLPALDMPQYISVAVPSGGNTVVAQQLVRTGRDTENKLGFFHKRHSFIGRALAAGVGVICSARVDDLKPKAKRSLQNLEAKYGITTLITTVVTTSTTEETKSSVLSEALKSSAVLVLGYAQPVKVTPRFESSVLELANQLSAILPPFIPALLEDASHFTAPLQPLAEPPVPASDCKIDAEERSRGPDSPDGPSCSTAMSLSAAAAPTESLEALAGLSSTQEPAGATAEGSCTAAVRSSARSVGGQASNAVREPRSDPKLVVDGGNTLPHEKRDEAWVPEFGMHSKLVWDEDGGEGGKKRRALMGGAVSLQLRADKPVFEDPEVERQYKRDAVNLPYSSRYYKFQFLALAVHAIAQFMTLVYNFEARKLPGGSFWLSCLAIVASGIAAFPAWYLTNQDILGPTVVVYGRLYMLWLSMALPTVSALRTMSRHYGTTILAQIAMDSYTLLGCGWKVRSLAVLLDVVGICFSARHGAWECFRVLTPRGETAGLLIVALTVEACIFKLGKKGQAESRHRYAASLARRAVPAGAF